jgi:hypothetical protein
MKRWHVGVGRALAGAAVLWFGACSARAEVVAGWHFNGLTAGVPGSIAADAGSGSVSLTQFTGGLGTLSGTDVNAWSGDPAGLALAVTGSGQNGRWIEITADTGGRSQLSLSMAARRSSSGFAQAVVEAWDGQAWRNAGTVEPSATQWQQHQVDLRDMAFLTNGSARLRIRLEGATSGSGNVRFDNLRLEAGVVPSPGSAAALGAAAAIGSRRGVRGQKSDPSRAQPKDKEGGAKPAQPAEGASAPAASSPAPRRAARGRSSRGSG